MWGRAILSGSLVFCAIGTMATGEAPEYAAGWAKDPWVDAGGIGGKRVHPRDRQPEPIRPVLPPVSRGSESHQYAIPSGQCITGVVIVPVRSYGESIRVTLVDGRSEYPMIVGAGQSFVLPFAKGWHSDGRAFIVGDGCRPTEDFIAWGITDDGPIRFDCIRR